MRANFLAAAGIGTAALALGLWSLTSHQQPDNTGARLSSIDVAAIDDAACPTGYKLRDPLKYAREFNPEMPAAMEAAIRKRYGDKVCSARRLPESMVEIGEWVDDRQNSAAAPYHQVPTGAFRAAVQQKSALQVSQKAVPNASGSWQPYGSGPQVSVEEFGEGHGDGIPSVNGRVDDFAYDPETKRLFASVGTGGVWMSQAVNGELATLGDNWVPIGDNLPTLINSSLAWTTANGGRLIVLTGEHVQGGNTYVGLGAYYSDNLGQTWQHARGIPDGIGGSQVVVDPANPNIVYAATHGGLYRSTDAGASFTNVALPVSPECAGSENYSGPCQLANVVSDVIVRMPGGSTDLTCEAGGCPVLAAVGYRSGNLPFQDGTPQSPGNGLYVSTTGEPGSFSRIDDGSGAPAGFASFPQIGRVELGAVTGADQNHDIVYAIVQDAALLNGGTPYLDALGGEGLPELDLPCDQLPEGDPQFVCDLASAGISPTSLNGIYVSTDFGQNWTLMADEAEIQASAVNGSSLIATAALGVGPGVQAWYDLWIAADPTATDPLTGAPTRLTFGMEEIWKNEGVGIPMDGVAQSANPGDFGVIGTYFAGETCLFLVGNIGPGVPACPTYDGVASGTTTHPDQHVGFYIPDEVNGGVWLFAGNDGGVYKQYSASPLTDDLTNNDWGDGANQGFYTLMNYGIAAAADGTVYYGLQDNASGKIEPDTRRQVRIYVGDGVWVEVDPNNSDTAFVQTPGLSINRTNDGGRTFTSVAPGAAEVGTGHFLGPFTMDPTDADHMLAVGTMVAETTNATTETTWVNVFDLGVNPVTGIQNQTRHRPVDVQGAAAYVGYCGACSVLDGTAQFQNGIATNVGGDLPPAKGSPDGWHHATAAGLPNRFIYGIEIDHQNPATVYVGLGGYSTARWLPPGGYQDQNPNLGVGHVYKSTDAGESFVDISGNLPEVAVTAILQRGNQLIVGTDIGVFISSDLNGSQWAPLGDLPNVPVNQLDLQPGDDRKLFAGTFGRGVQLYEFSTAATPGIPGSGSGSGSGAGTGDDGGRFGSGALSLITLLSLVLLGAGPAMLARRRQSLRRIRR